MTHRSAVVTGLYRSARGLCLLGALAWPQVGCKALREGPASLVQDMMPPTPGEAARDVFDLYDADKRRRAVNLLAAAPFGGEGPYVRLYRLVVDDPDPTVRAAAVKALGLHGEVSDVPVITVRLRDEAAAVRWEAAKALQKIHNPFAVKPLTEALLQDEDSDVRMACAEALAQYPQPEVFSTLVAALGDPVFGVQRRAADSLTLLTGQALGADGAAWLKWREQNTQTIFAGQQPYYWQPYTPPRGLLDKAQFWKKPKVITPQTPRGADQDV